jgi:hypothetical protein
MNLSFINFILLSFRSRIKSGMTSSGFFVSVIINSFKQNIFYSSASTTSTVIPDLIRDLNFMDEVHIIILNLFQDLQKNFSLFQKIRELMNRTLSLSEVKNVITTR